MPLEWNACARQSRVCPCYTTWCAPIIRCCAAVGGSAALRMRHTPCGCRSASLAVVQPNHRLPEHSTMRRASAMLLFRTQSAAVLTSLAPHDSKARLQAVTTRRGSWRSHVHRTRFRRLSSSSRSRLPMSGVEGNTHRLSLGVPKGVFSLERESPPCPASPRRWDRTPRPLGIQKENTAFAV